MREVMIATAGHCSHRSGRRSDTPRRPGRWSLERVARGFAISCSRRGSTPQGPRRAGDGHLGGADPGRERCTSF